MKNVVIVSACRTAIGSFGGTLRDLSAPVLGSIVMKEAVKRADIDPAIIDDVRFGCCFEPIDALNVTRVTTICPAFPIPCLDPVGATVYKIMWLSTISSVAFMLAHNCYPVRKKVLLRRKKAVP
ncbi:MAG: Acetyl-CoA acetyltransferase [Smithella sp. PtaU1.Bin162]|nr:MAG: Acetyl-CoA acetyltransferase [Smithella sp. PtaU1.Bin162]